MPDINKKQAVETESVEGQESLSGGEEMKNQAIAEQQEFQGETLDKDASHEGTETRSPKALPSSSSASAAQAVIQQADEELKLIEDILSEGLEDIYRNLPTDKKLPFRRKGEEVAVKVKGLLSEAKIRVNKIIGLLIDWLKMIPGVNVFFLKQEAKIKTDKLLGYIKDKRQGGIS